MEEQEQAYGRLVEALELQGLFLVELRYHAVIPVEGRVEITQGIKFRKEDSLPNQIIALALFELHGRSGDTDSLDIEMTWRLEYRLGPAEGETFDEDLVEKFIERNAVINVWPYIRETVASLTGKMGRQPLVLPLLNVKR